MKGSGRRWRKMRERKEENEKGKKNENSSPFITPSDGVVFTAWWRGRGRGVMEMGGGVSGEKGPSDARARASLHSPTPARRPRVPPALKTSMAVYKKY